MSRKQRFLYTVLALVILLFVFIFVSGNKAKKNVKKDVMLPISVLTESVVRGPIQEEIIFTGTLEGKEQAMITSQTAGLIEKVSFHAGQACAKNQIIAQVENSQQEAGVEQARAQLLAAETNYEKAEKDLARANQLYTDKVVTKDNLEMAQLGVKAAFAQLKGAQAALKVAEKAYNDTFIKAPIAGHVGTRLVNLGQTIAPGVPVATIVDDSAFRMKIYVPESDITKFKPNQVVNVTVDAIPENNFKGVVTAVGLAFEGNGTSYPVEIAIQKNGSAQIKAGMFARAVVSTSKKTDAMLIPATAILMENNKPFVFVSEGNKCVRKNVQIGLRNSSQVEVIDGIDMNMQIITVGKDQVTEGATIQVTKQAL